MSCSAAIICKPTLHGSLGPWPVGDTGPCARQQASFLIRRFLRFLVCVVVCIIKRIDEPVFNQIAARRAVRTIKRTHVLDRARQAWSLLDTGSVNREFDGVKFVGPPAAFKYF